MDNFEKFKYEWLMAHDVPVNRLVKSLLSYASNFVKSGDDLLLMDVDAFMNEWENNCGIDGAVWPCEGEYEDCEKKESESSGCLSVPIATYQSPTGDTLPLMLTAEVNPAPEFGAELIIGLTSDDNGEWLQNLAVVREKNNRMEVLLYEDETDDDNYTKLFKIKIWPEFCTSVKLPDEFFSEDKYRKYPDEWPKPPAEAKKLTPDEALAASIKEFDRVNMEFMETVTGLDEFALEEQLKGKIFVLPEPADEDGRNKFVTAAEYLMGTKDELEKRLRDAEMAAEYSESFDANVAELKVILGEKSYLDERSRKYIREIGGWIDEQDMIHVYDDAPYLDDSVKYPGKKSLLVPMETGIALIIEGLHFILEKKEDRGGNCHD